MPTVTIHKVQEVRTTPSLDPPPLPPPSALYIFLLRPPTFDIFLTISLQRKSG